MAPTGPAQEGEEERRPRRMAILRERGGHCDRRIRQVFYDRVCYATGGILRGPSASEHRCTSILALARVSALSHKGFSHRRGVLRPGMTREHPRWQHPQYPAVCGGLAVVAHTHKCSCSNVSILFFLKFTIANLYGHFWCCLL